MPVVGWDTETYLIAEGQIVPRLVCATFDVGPETTAAPDDQTERWCVPNADPQLVSTLGNLFQSLLRREDRLVIQNAAFDLTVALRYAWDVQEGTQVGNKSEAQSLYGSIWEALEQSMDDELAGKQPFIHDTIIREKLYNLSTHGGIDQYRGRDLRYGLSDLVQLYFGIDISDGKITTNAEGRIFDHNNVDITGTPKAAAAWRLRYSQLDGVPLSQWPPEAVQYAISDASWARRVWVMQELNRQPSGYGSMCSESLQVYADTALRLYTITGFHVDHARVEKVQDAISTVTSKVDSLLVLNGVLRVDGSINTKVLHERIESAWAAKGLRVVRTETGRISASGDVLELLEGTDPIVDMYAERQSLAKIRDAFLPNLAGQKVYTNYDILKETGRTSSYGSSEKSKRKPLYPAENVQQIPRKFGIREAHLPPPGYVLMSGDYQSLELCSVAQVTYSLFKQSVHRDKINQGYDLHTYLGSGMAMLLDPEVVGHATDREHAYANLMAARKANIPDTDMSQEAQFRRDLKKRAGEWRNFSKPTGLGYPGGLGPATQVTFARTTYNVSMTEEQAYQFRDIWRRVYPEMPRFFQWVDQQVDHSRPGEDLYCYETQGFGRFRAGATFCATANGKSMQSLSADGAKRSVAWIARACFGGLVGLDTPYKVLEGCLPMAFIHDENILAIPDDDLLTERSLLACKLMVRAMEVHMPDVRQHCEPALMRRWTKAAEAEWVADPARADRVRALLGEAMFAMIAQELGPSYDPTKRLVPWDDHHTIKD